MNFRSLKKGEITRPTDERKISMPGQPEKWETSVLGGPARVESDGMYRRPCSEETYKLYRACEIIMAAAKKYCLKEFFHEPLAVLFRMQEENCPAYNPKEGENGKAT